MTHNNCIRTIFVLAASIFIIGVGGCNSFAADSASNSFVEKKFEQSNAVLPNPERGFYRSVGNLDDLSKSEIESAFDSGYRLLFVKINLDSFRHKNISKKYLKKLEKGFENAREGGVKLIIRAAYNYPQGETGYEEAEDASLAQVKRHASQLKPVLEENYDVIAFVQAGFVGAWGEWHTSSNNLTSEANRPIVRDAILDAVPSTRFAQFRYPPYIREWITDIPDWQDTVYRDFRIGFHNDCFLASDTDVGTYSDDPVKRREERGDMERLSAATPFGGETCKPADAPGAVARTSCEDILSEGRRYHLTYLNDGYYRPLFHENWIEQSCIAEIERDMGYRVSLTEVAHPSAVRAGETLNVAIGIKNEGWARIYNERAVEIVLIDQADPDLAYRIEAKGVDPRLWGPRSGQVEVLEVPIPAGLATGVYDVSLSLPDRHWKLKTDGRYAIRFANADDAENGQHWNADLGIFSFGTTLEVKD